MHRWTLRTAPLAAAIAITASALSVTATTAHAQTLSNPNVTAVSGHRATDITWLESGSNENGLGGLAWSENDDKPCTMVVAAKRLNNGAGTGGGGSLNLCRDGISWWPAGVSQLLDVLNRGQTKGVELSAQRSFIRGIAACNTNANNNRIKGVRIWAATVDANTFAVTPTNNRVEDRHTNCATWDSPAYCPNDAIAVAVVVHHDRDAITGLALRCMRVGR
jgi:hypothetical protein